MTEQQVPRSAEEEKALFSAPVHISAFCRKVRISPPILSRVLNEARLELPFDENKRLDPAQANSLSRAINSLRQQGLLKPRKSAKS